MSGEWKDPFESTRRGRSDSFDIERKKFLGDEADEDLPQLPDHLGLEEFNFGFDNFTTLNESVELEQTQKKKPSVVISVNELNNEKKKAENYKILVLRANELVKKKDVEIQNLQSKLLQKKLKTKQEKEYQYAQSKKIFKKNMFLFTSISALAGLLIGFLVGKFW